MSTPDGEWKNQTIPDGASADFYETLADFYGLTAKTASQEIRKEIFDGWYELANATLSTEKFLATHLQELDYGLNNEIFQKIYKHLSVLRESPAWIGFWSPLDSIPSSNWQIVLPLSQLVPKKDEVVWFMVDLPLLSLWPVFEGNIDIIEKVSNQCRLLEYYVISKDFSWVIAKSRHDEIFVNGDEVERNLMKLKRSHKNLD